ncbi:MAG: hypothetical protein KGV44_12720 [Flavobacteriaceae bacterium]|nr:hypothetical protein [Flavobacteriaceae bacterium]
MKDVFLKNDVLANEMDYLLGGGWKVTVRRKTNKDGSTTTEIIVEKN